MIQRKLLVLGKAGLTKDNFEESEERNMEMEKQKTMEDFFKSEVKESEDVESLWGEMTDEDLAAISDVEPPVKKIKT